VVGALGVHRAVFQRSPTDRGGRAVWSRPYALLAIASGSAALRVVSERSTTIGLPVQVQVCVRPIRGAGLDVTLFGNVNPAQPFAGVAVALQLGDGS